MNPPETFASVDEAKLIERVVAGDMAAARQLYDAHVDDVHRLARRMTRDDAVAEEVTQDAFVRVFRALPRFRGEAKLRTWIHEVTVSAALNAIRGRKRWFERTTEIEEAESLPRQTSMAEPDLRDRLYAAIDALPDIYRSVFVLFDVQGHTHEEIGRLLRIPSGTSKARLSQARSRLRSALHDFRGESASA